MKRGRKLKFPSGTCLPGYVRRRPRAPGRVTLMLRSQLSHKTYPEKGPVIRMQVFVLQFCRLRISIVRLAFEQKHCSHLHKHLTIRKIIMNKNSEIMHILLCTPGFGVESLQLGYVRLSGLMREAALKSAWQKLPAHQARFAGQKPSCMHPSQWIRNLCSSLRDFFSLAASLTQSGLPLTLSSAAMCILGAFLNHASLRVKGRGRQKH